MDAAAIDQLVLDGLEDLLMDAAILRTQLNEGRDAERMRLAGIAAEANDALAVAARGLAAGDRLLANALSGGDQAQIDAVLRSQTVLQADIAVAERRRDEAVATLAAFEDQGPDASADERIAAALRGRIRDAAGDIKTLNIALREVFGEFEIRTRRDGALMVIPSVHPHIAAEIHAGERPSQEPWVGVLYPAANLARPRQCDSRLHGR